MVAAVFAAVWIPTAAAAQVPPYSNPDPPTVQVLPATESRSTDVVAAPGTEVLGTTQSRSAGLPVTGSDVAGLVVIGGGIAGVGVAAVAASRRRSAARV
ncbi:MAG: hypothetical protein ABIX10_03955 [Acidimicrobiales bacterium]